MRYPETVEAIDEWYFRMLDMLEERRTWMMKEKGWTKDEILEEMEKGE